jgi:hypothetical protein
MIAVNKSLTELMKLDDLTACVINQGGSVGSTLQTPPSVVSIP